MGTSPSRRRTTTPTNSPRPARRLGRPGVAAGVATYPTTAREPVTQSSAASPSTATTRPGRPPRSAGRAAPPRTGTTAWAATHPPPTQTSTAPATPTPLQRRSPRHKTSQHRHGTTTLIRDASVPSPSTVRPATPPGTFWTASAPRSPAPAAPRSPNSPLRRLGHATRFETTGWSAPGRLRRRNHRTPHRAWTTTTPAPTTRAPDLDQPRPLARAPHPTPVAAPLRVCRGQPRATDSDVLRIQGQTATNAEGMRRDIRLRLPLRPHQAGTQRDRARQTPRDQPHPSPTRARKTRAARQTQSHRSEQPKQSPGQARQHRLDACS